ncbi:MAG: MerR family transcriptional regulator [Clostridiales bacterium]|nr:MerR family transcriptional regulator [Clostridiales bacterium]MDD6089527.1 MerR family transcriptional regulator [Clostridiales bacterium]
MELPKLFQIGEVSKLFHLSASSIRHYEELGLLTPEYIDPSSGYRYYSPRQFEAFNTIRYLRALDMPLMEIADYLRDRDVDKTEAKLRQQKQAVVLKQQELQRIERKIDKRLEQLHDARTSELDQIGLVCTPACRMFLMGGSLKITNYHDMELPTIKLAQSQAEAVIFLGKVGLSISPEHLYDGSFGQYDGIFLVLDEEDRFSGSVMDIPEMLCARIRFRGSHTEAPEQYRKLMDFICGNGLAVSGFSREITMIDYGITNDPEKFVTEICIPVTPGPAEP